MMYEVSCEAAADGHAGKVRRRRRRERERGGGGVLGGGPGLTAVVLAGREDPSQLAAGPEGPAARHQVQGAGPGQVGRDQLQRLLERLERPGVRGNAAGR